MGIYRGAGGTGDAINDASSEARLAVEARDAAIAAKDTAVAAKVAAELAETNAEAAETNAETAETNAETAATAAQLAETNAETAQAAAEVARNAAQLAETNAETAETNAETAETNANASAALAQDWATKTSGTVAGGEYSAKYHAQAASTSASNASTSATNASNSATAAAASATSAAASYDAFDDRYLGSKSSNPTVDNDGNALLTGALYYNTVAPEMRIWTGTDWVFIGASGTAGVNSFNTRFGDITLTSSDVTTALTYTPLAPAAIGTTVQAYDADLTAFAGKTAPTGAVVGTSDTQTLTNKTLTDPTINGNVSTTGLNIDSNTLVVDATNNNVGIGTSSPAVSLDITSTSGIRLQNATAGGSADLQLQGRGSDGISGALTKLSGFPEGAGTASALLFSTRNAAGTVAEKMRIDSSGNVGIGTNSILNGRLNVVVDSTNFIGLQTFRAINTVGGGYQALAMSMRDSASATVTYGSIVPNITTNTAGSHSGSVAIYTANAGTNAERMRITSAGGVSFGATGTAYGTTGQVLTSAGDAPPTWSSTISGNLGVTAGSTSSSFVEYNGTTATAGQFDGGTTTPTGTTRLNYGGYIYPTAINLLGTGDTATVATNYYVETASDGFVRPKTLANVKTEIVTSAAVIAGLGYTPYNSTNPSGYTTNTGTVTSVAAGNGMTFTTITGTGTVTMGTPGTLTNTTTNSVSTGSHTHALSGELVQGTTGSAPYYGSRAWVNFNGTGTVAIRASGNVSSITDNGVGDYTVNFTTAMPDINYSACGSTHLNTTNSGSLSVFTSTSGYQAPLVGSFRLLTYTPGTGVFDSSSVSVSVFR